MSKSLEFFVSTPHWLDALSPPLERHLAQLADTLKLLLERVGRRRGALTEADLEAAGADSTVKPPAQPPARPPVVPPAESRPAMPPPGETQPQAAAGQAQPGSGAGAMTGEKPISARPAVPPVLPVPPQMPPQRPPQGSSQGPNMPPRLPLPPRPAGPLGFLDSWFGPMNPNTRTLILVVGIVVLLLLGCVFLSCLGSVLNHA